MSCKVPHMRHRAFLREVGPRFDPQPPPHPRRVSFQVSPSPPLLCPAVRCLQHACACGRVSVQAPPQGSATECPWAPDPGVAFGPFTGLALEKAGAGQKPG